MPENKHVFLVLKVCVGHYHPILDDPRWSDKKAAQACPSRNAFGCRARAAAASATGGNLEIMKLAYQKAYNFWVSVNCS